MVRQKTLTDDQTKLASILSILNKQTDKLNEMILLSENTSKESEQYLQGDKLDPQVISNYFNYIKRLQNDIKLQREVLNKTKEVLNNQQQIVKEAYIKVKSLENLHTKQKEQYLKEFQQEEFKELDDIVNSRRNIA